MQIRYCWGFQKLSEDEQGSLEHLQVLWKILVGQREVWNTPVSKRQGNLWQQAGQLSEGDFKLKDLGGRVKMAMLMPSHPTGE